MRKESDLLGEIEIPDDAYWGVNTQRALENFAVSELWLPHIFTKAMAEVKLACARTNFRLGYLSESKFEAISYACEEIREGKYNDQFVLDALQGGAGTSANMNANEVIANLAIEYLHGKKGDYFFVHPLHDVNMHQSTNDVYPTASRIALLYLLKDLELQTGYLQEEFQKKESEFHQIVKLGRTQLQDAVPMTLGQEFSAYAEALSRDRWRIFKCRERIKVLNLGGTAIGTGLGAPREYIFRVVEALKEITGLTIARSENPVETTQNLDPYVEVSGMLKTLAVNLMKIANDLRLLASGPHGGLGEINLPAMQAGSSIMPTKVNPVIPEMVVQVALKVIGNDGILTNCAALGNLELNQFMPLINYSILESASILNKATRIFADKCISGITVNEDVCKEHLMKGSILATVLVPELGYKQVEALMQESVERKLNIREIILEKKLLTEAQLDELLEPKRMYKLGF
ncbi:MAG: aspartate ammonia-lyase [Candidatus Cloacimonetes bacterium]|nr:aspartate ammonia-lyase [Candidatus Cloacimonadota bacterium]